MNCFSPIALVWKVNLLLAALKDAAARNHQRPANRPAWYVIKARVLAAKNSQQIGSNWRCHEYFVLHSSLRRKNAAATGTTQQPDRDRGHCERKYTSCPDAHQGRSRSVNDRIWALRRRENQKKYDRAAKHSQDGELISPMLCQHQLPIPFQIQNATAKGLAPTATQIT